MHTRFRWMISLLWVVFVSPCAVDAQDATTSSAYELQPIFSDDFSKDTRGDYTIAGDVTWEAGRLTLQPNASCARAFKAGARVKVEMTLDWPELTKEQPESELQIWLGLKGTTDCFVSLRRKLTDQGPTALVSLFDTGEQDGKLAYMLACEHRLESVRLEQLEVEYRYGLVRVTADDVVVLTGHIGKANAAISGVGAAVPATSLNVDEFVATGIPARDEVNAEQQQQLANANAAARLIDLSDEGKFAEAASIGEGVLQIRMAVLGPDHPDTATGLNNLAALYYLQANYAAAEPLYLRVLESREKSLGPDHPATAMSLGNLAELYNSQANYAAAEPLYRRALEIREKSPGPDHPDTATSLNYLAGLYIKQANYAAAEPLCLRALEIYEKALGPDDPATASSLGNLASLHKSQSNYAAAEPLYLRALEIYEKALGPDHPHTATILNNLAGLYISQANYAAAEPLVVRALEIREKARGPEHHSTAMNLDNLAGLYIKQANYAAAAPLYLRALEICEKALGPDHPDTATSLNNLASLYDSQANYAAAEPHYLRALEIYEKALGPEHPHTATSLDNLARLYKSQTNYAAAEPLYLRALEIYEKALGPDHPDTATSLNNLAGLYISQANYAAAEPLVVRALEIYEKALGPEHPNTATSLSNLALLQWEHDQEFKAVSLAERALGIQLRHLDATAAIQTEQQQFLMSHNVGNSVSFWLTVTGVDAQWTSNVYRDMLAWKGLITARQQGLRLALKDDPLFEDFRQVTQQLSTVALNPPLPPSDPAALVAWKERELEMRRNWVNQKTMLQAEHERLEKELAVKSVPFRESLEQRRMQPDELVDALNAQDRPTALVDVLEYGYIGRKNKEETSERRIVAFVVRGDRPIMRVELGSADAIATQVAHWREGIEGQLSGKDHGAELRKQVWLPLEPHLQGIETVLISPDGPLAQLPWAALPGTQPGSYLLEERAIAVIPVPQMLPLLLRQEHRTGPPESLLLAGNIEYGGDPGQRQDLLANRGAVGRLREGRMMQFSQLPAANAELASIEGRYRKQVQSGKSSTLENREATEAAFSEQAAQHQWLHVITHGYFAPETVRSALQPADDEISALRLIDQPRTVKGEHPGLLSGLAFAGANTSPESEKDDGILTALEVESLQLNNVDTVVLSACETGLGKVAGGEGLLGLQRAVQLAGAKTCVASLWKVPDAATARLMQLFYENLWEKKMGKLDALRDAQLTMLRHYDPKSDQLRGLGTKSGKIDPNKKPDPTSPATRLDPRYWAAFQLSGDWR